MLSQGTSDGGHSETPSTRSASRAEGEAATTLPAEHLWTFRERPIWCLERCWNHMKLWGLVDDWLFGTWWWYWYHDLSCSLLDMNVFHTGFLNSICIIHNSARIYSQRCNIISTIQHDRHDPTILKQHHIILQNVYELISKIARQNGWTAVYSSNRIEVFHEKAR